MKNQIIWFAFAVIVAGCGTEDETIEPSIELGTGSSIFEPLEEEQGIEIIFGPQGGYHFLVSMRIQGVHPGDSNDLASPDNPLTEFKVFEGERRWDAAASRYRQGLKPGNKKNEFVMIGRLLILDIDDDSELHGKSLKVEVTFEDVQGNRLIDSKNLNAFVQ